MLVPPGYVPTLSERKQDNTPKTLLATDSSSPMKCEYCSEGHKLCFCKKFAKQSLEARRDFVGKNRICFNCLGSNHTVYNCKKSTSCRVCQKRHHSLLHSDNKGQDPEAKPTTDSASPSTSTTQVVSCLSTGRVAKPSQVLLATALVKASSKTGEYHTVRALIDQGSQACFITEATVQYLSLKKIPIQGIVSGLGDNRSTMTKYMVQLTIKSRVDPSFKFSLSAYVLKKITSYLPERSLHTDTFDWLGINNLYLADPEFKTPNQIDILLGADVYSCIIKKGLLKSPSGTLIAKSTTLGWVLSGAVSPGNTTSANSNINVKHCKVEDFLRKFWEVEEFSTSKKVFTPEEKKCEEFYRQTTRRDSNGRYIVRLPFQDEDPPCKAGNSRGIAKLRFKALERRLMKNKDLKEKYTEVRNEYLQLGHMRHVKEDDGKKEDAVYLPHHAVIRNDRITTKVRVVFNASEKNSNGVSLNDTLMVGPSLQADLRHTVLRWRIHPIGLVADIVKMYRQVKVAEEDAMFQRILWRDSPDKEIQDYELLTVTFGTASAPYQAVKTLRQIAVDEGTSYPLASDKVLNCFYMDDLMTGCNSVEEGIEIYRQIIALLGKVGFILQKWNSNSQDLLKRIDKLERNKVKVQIDQTRTTENKDTIGQGDIIQNYELDKKEYKEENGLEIKLDSTIKILGLTWNRNEDTFQYLVKLPPPTTAPVTKRSIISDIARLFDPLGWLAPSVVLAKTFIQKLWLAGVSWDEELSTQLIKEWNIYRDELSQLSNVRIPRWLGTKSNDDLELHGFSDASKIAYSAVIYLRIVDEVGKIHISLLVAKTRVAPVKQISIPRSELCGAVLLSNLLTETADVLNISRDRIKAWTDSTVVLAWLNSHPSRWKTFVANRTSEILTNMKASQWFHVNTQDNPADCASRGILPSALINSSLWFCGPPFLSSRWLLGRVIEKHPGDDNITRVVTLRTKISTIKRPTSKLCILPVTDQ